MTLKATTYLHICKGIRKQNADFTYNFRVPVTICRFHLQLRISQQVKLTKHLVLLFVCGINRLFWNPQTRLRIPQVRLFLQQFLVVQSFRYVFVCGTQNSKEDQRKELCCGFRKKSDFVLLMNPLTMHRMHILAS